MKTYFDDGSEKLTTALELLYRLIAEPEEPTPNTTSHDD